MTTSKSRDATLSAIVEVLLTIDAALLAADANPWTGDDVRGELAAKWMETAAKMVPLRARSPGGKRAKAIVLQMINDRLQVEPSLFVDLSISLCLDHARPLQKASRGPPS
jgi:hypothetical protein